MIAFQRRRFMKNTILIVSAFVFCFVLFLFFGDYHVSEKELFGKGEITVRSPHSAGFFDSEFIAPSESDGETIRQWLLTLKKTEEKHLENLQPDLYISYGKERLGSKGILQHRRHTEYLCLPLLK